MSDATLVLMMIVGMILGHTFLMYLLVSGSEISAMIRQKNYEAEKDNARFQ